MTNLREHTFAKIAATTKEATHRHRRQGAFFFTFSPIVHKGDNHATKQIIRTHTYTPTDPAIHEHNMECTHRRALLPLSFNWRLKTKINPCKKTPLLSTTNRSRLLKTKVAFNSHHESCQPYCTCYRNLGILSPGPSREPGDRLLPIPPTPPSLFTPPPPRPCPPAGPGPNFCRFPGCACCGPSSHGGGELPRLPPGGRPDPKPCGGNRSCPCPGPHALPGGGPCDENLGLSDPLL